jgi:hypothetical protein
MAKMVQVMVSIIFSILVIRLGQSADGPSSHISNGYNNNDGNGHGSNNGGMMLGVMASSTPTPGSAAGSAAGNGKDRSRRHEHIDVSVDANSVDGLPPSDGDVSAAQLAAMSNIVEQMVAQRLQRQPSTTSSTGTAHRSGSVGGGGSSSMDDDVVDAASPNRRSDIPQPPTNDASSRYHSAHDHKADARDDDNIDNGIPEPSTDWMIRLSQNSEVVQALLMQRLNRLMLEAACLIGIAIVFWFQVSCCHFSFAWAFDRWPGSLTRSLAGWLAHDEW